MSSYPDYESLPDEIGPWTLERCKNGHGEILGAKYTAVVETGERAVVTSAATATGTTYSNYALYQEPRPDEDYDWGGPEGFEDLLDFVDREAGFTALVRYVKATSPGEIVGSSQQTLTEATQ